MSRPTTKPTITMPTLEQMREIVTAADSIERYCTQLAQVRESLATGQVDWQAMLVFLASLSEAFAMFHNPKPASKPPKPPPLPTEAKPRGDVHTVQGPNGLVSGTLGQLCVLFGKDYGKTYQLHKKGGKSIEEALKLGKTNLPLASASSNPE